MKKNTKTYILLGVVVLIWGAIGFQIIGSLSSEPTNTTVTGTTNFKAKPIKEKDTFSIAANYRDPFLGTLPRAKRKKTAKTKTVKETLPEIQIKYTGSILDKETKQRIFFVSIAGQQHLMRVKNKVGEVTLVSGTDKVIKVKSRKKLRTIPLQQ